MGKKYFFCLMLASCIVQAPPGAGCSVDGQKQLYKSVQTQTDPTFEYPVYPVIARIRIELNRMLRLQKAEFQKIDIEYQQEIKRVRNQLAIIQKNYALVRQRLALLDAVARNNEFIHNAKARAVDDRSLDADDILSELLSDSGTDHGSFKIVPKRHLSRPILDWLQEKPVCPDFSLDPCLPMSSSVDI